MAVSSSPLRTGACEAVTPRPPARAPQGRAVGVSEHYRAILLAQPGSRLSVLPTVRWRRRWAQSLEEAGAERLVTGCARASREVVVRHDVFPLQVSKRAYI